MPHDLRTFIAAELSLPTKQGLQDLQNILQQTATDIKWIKPDNLHLTLRFLGEISPKRVKRIKKLLPQNIAAFPSFEISLDHWGAFPSIQSPKIFWIGVGKGLATLNELAGMVENAVNDAGLPKSGKPFCAHITLGRIRSADNLAGLTRQINRGPFPQPLSQSVSSVTLFQSILTPRGPTYISLLTVNLRSTLYPKHSD